MTLPSSAPGAGIMEGRVCFHGVTRLPEAAC